MCQVWTSQIIKELKICVCVCVFSSVNLKHMASPPFKNNVLVLWFGVLVNLQVSNSGKIICESNVFIFDDDKIISTFNKNNDDTQIIDPVS